MEWHGKLQGTENVLHQQLPVTAILDLRKCNNFSVLNHKQFVSLPQSRKTSDLLKTLNLSERLIRSEGCTPVELQEKLINQNIDYSGVDADIERMRSDSLRLLKDALKKYE